MQEKSHLEFKSQKWVITPVIFLEVCWWASSWDMVLYIHDLNDHNSPASWMPSFSVAGGKQTLSEVKESKAPKLVRSRRLEPAWLQALCSAGNRYSTCSATCQVCDLGQAAWPLCAPSFYLEDGDKTCRRVLAFKLDHMLKAPCVFYYFAVGQTDS